MDKTYGRGKAPYARNVLFKETGLQFCFDRWFPVQGEFGQGKESACLVQHIFRSLVQLVRNLRLQRRFRPQIAAIGLQFLPEQAGYRGFVLSFDLADNVQIRIRQTRRPPLSPCRFQAQKSGKTVTAEAHAVRCRRSGKPCIIASQSQVMDDGCIVPPGSQETDIIILVVFPVSGLQGKCAPAQHQSRLGRCFQIGRNIARTGVNGPEFMERPIVNGPSIKEGVFSACITGVKLVLLFLQIPAHRVNGDIRGEQLPVGRCVPIDSPLHAPFIRDGPLCTMQRVQPMARPGLEFSLAQALSFGGKEGVVLRDKPVTRLRPGIVAARGEEQ